MVVHRGETEAPLPPEVLHLHADRRDLVGLRGEIAAFAPAVAIDMLARSALDARLALEALASSCGRLIVASSLDVYRGYELFARLADGPPEPQPLGEAARLREARYPRRAEAIGPGDWRHDYDKVLVEAEHLRAGRLPATILRLPFVYGPGDYRRRLADLLRAMARGEELVLPRARAAWRASRAFVDNVAAAFALAALDPRAAGRTYNVGEPALAEAEWIARVGEAVGWRGAFSAHDAGGNEGPCWRHHLELDTRRIRGELGYAEEVSLAEGLARTLRYSTLW
jgi:nucleoside-diphosphate-sugar epimerase